MDVPEVRELVRNGKAVKDPHYHPGKRGISFHAILVALERCYHVAKDERRTETGRRLHPYGWYAFANLPYKRRLRIDFDAHKDEQGALLLIVTAYHV